jgi:hypothetical protein
MLDDEIKEKVNLRLTIEALKTNLQWQISPSGLFLCLQKT